MTNWNEEVQRAVERATEVATAVIRKKGNEFCIYSKTGKNLGCYSTKKQARDRLAEIEKFKHMKENK